MATAAELLTQTEAAIEGLLNALADTATQEYTVQGKTWKRADFPGCLNALMKTRDLLQKETNARRSGLRLVTVRRPGGVC